MLSWKLHGDGKSIKPGEVVGIGERLTWPRTIGFAATAFTCPMFSAISTKTTGRNKIMALDEKVGVVKVGIPTQAALLTPAKSTSPIRAATT